jgi:hypothetical protein
MVAFRILLNFLSILFFALIASFIADAKTDFNIDSGNKLTGKLSSEYGQISNFFSERTNEKSTGYFKLAPSFFIQTQLSRHLMQLDGNISHYKFTDSSEDNHSDLSFKPKYFFKIDKNKTLFAEVKLLEAYEYRGTGLSLGNAQSLSTGDDKKTVSTNVGYLYGQIDSVAKLKFSVGKNDFRYKTRRSVNESLDREDSLANVAFDYLLSGKTYFAVDLAYTQSDFQYNEQLNKETFAALVGLKWQSTAITQLQALMGYQELNFEDKSLASDSGFKWRVDMNWHPRTYTKMNVNTQRSFEATNRLADSYRVVDSHNLQITNQFTNYFQTSAVIGYRQEKIIYADKTDKESYIYSEVKLNYQRNKWLTVFAGFTFKDFDASQEKLNYQGNSLSFGFSVTI